MSFGITTSGEIILNLSIPTGFDGSTYGLSIGYNHSEDVLLQKLNKVLRQTPMGMTVIPLPILLWGL